MHGRRWKSDFTSTSLMSSTSSSVNSLIVVFAIFSSISCTLQASLRQAVAFDAAHLGFANPDNSLIGTKDNVPLNALKTHRPVLVPLDHVHLNSIREVVTTYKQLQAEWRRCRNFCLHSPIRKHWLWSPTRILFLKRHWCCNERCQCWSSRSNP